MPNQHKHPPIAYRPPVAIRARLMAHHDQTGMAVSAILTTALDAFLPPECQHPESRVHKGLCGACGTHT
jgi:hypothetical protein